MLKLNSALINPLLGPANPGGAWELDPSHPRALGNAIKHLPLAQPANQPLEIMPLPNLDGILLPADNECPMVQGPRLFGSQPAVEGDDEVPAPVQTALEMLNEMSTYEILQALREGTLPEEILSDPEAMAVIEERVSAFEAMLDFVVHLLEAGKAAQELLGLLRGR